MTGKTFLTTFAMIGLMIGVGTAFLVLPPNTERVPVALAEAVPAGEQSPETGGVTSRAVLAQESIFLKLGPIKGHATTVGFQDQIVIADFSYQITQQGEWEEGARLTGRITKFGDMKLVKYGDRASPSLAYACSVKDQFPKAELAVISGKDIYMKVTLEDVIVSSIEIDFDPASGRPIETFTLRYRKALWEWGPVKAGYDLIKNVKM